MTKLKINRYTGPTDGADLEGLYFEPSGNGYNLYVQVQLNTQLITPQNPTLTIQIPNAQGQLSPSFIVTVTSFPNMTLSGTWNDGGSESIKDTPGSGTFQAQAGGTGTFDEEVAAAAAK